MITIMMILILIIHHDDNDNDNATNNNHDDDSGVRKGCQGGGGVRGQFTKQEPGFQRFSLEHILNF